MTTDHCSTRARSRFSIGLTCAGSVSSVAGSRWQSRTSSSSSETMALRLTCAPMTASLPSSSTASSKARAPSPTRTRQGPASDSSLAEPCQVCPSEAVSRNHIPCPPRSRNAPACRRSTSAATRVFARTRASKSSTLAFDIDISLRPPHTLSAQSRQRTAPPSGPKFASARRPRARHFQVVAQQFLQRLGQPEMDERAQVRLAVRESIEVAGWSRLAPFGQQLRDLHHLPHPVWHLATHNRNANAPHTTLFTHPHRGQCLS